LLPTGAFPSMFPRMQLNLLPILLSPQTPNTQGRKAPDTQRSDPSKRQAGVLGGLSIANPSSVHMLSSPVYFWELQEFKDVFIHSLIYHSVSQSVNMLTTTICQIPGCRLGTWHWYKYAIFCQLTGETTLCHFIVHLILFNSQNTWAHFIDKKTRAWNVK
jgi:hypothetical protein